MNSGSGSKAGIGSGVADGRQPIVRRRHGTTLEAAQYEFALGILDKRYVLYDWCEKKANTLVTVDGLLLSATFLVVGKLPRLSDPLNIGLWATALFFFATSLVISLLHIIPKMDSKIGNGLNPRATIGIERYTKAEYCEVIRALDADAMLRHTTDQLKGMNRNIMRNQRALRVAVYATLAGMVPLFGVVGRASL